MTTVPSLPFGSLQSLPLGARIPPSVHAVTCSLPTMRDVIGYEEKKPETLQAMKTGYPRFVTHFYLRQVIAHLREHFGLQGRELFLSTSPEILREAMKEAADPRAGIVQTEDFSALHIPASSPGAGRAKSYMQHVGGGISSRLAEHYLLHRNLIEKSQEESRSEPETAEMKVRTKLATLFGASPEDVFPTNSGMNAFYAVFRELNSIQKKRGRRDWIQLGWLYLDTIEILTKFSDGKRIYFPNVLDLSGFERYLTENAENIAGIVTEAPTNPLVETPNLPRLRELSKKFDIPLIVDPTLASPYNIDVLPHCDIAVNSLTKYAANRGDVMLGAIVLNRNSSWAKRLNPTENRWLVPPFSGDLARLAFEIGDYDSVVEKINSNALALTGFLENHPAVKSVFSPYQGTAGENYRRLERRPDSPGGIISISLKIPLADFYDRVRLPKGPSFGALFTLLCPFLYLAHYDLVSTESGRKQLAESGIDPELIRISVGTEDPELIIDAFRDALG